MGILTELYQLVTRHLGTTENRMRLKGSRIQIVLSIKAKYKTSYKVLLVKSGFSNTWGLPQEGVSIGEDFIDAIKRCLAVEIGVRVDNMDNSTFERTFNIRKINYVDTLDLPKARHNERHVTDNAAGTIYESITCKSKSYWVSDLTVTSIDDMEIHPDNIEVIDYKWLEIDEAVKLLKDSNRKEKADLFISCFK